MSTVNYKLNVRFLAKLIIVVLVAIGSVFFLHRYQESRLTSRYLSQANNARDAGQPLAELSYLKQYIAMNPSDNAARIRYGEVMSRHGRRPAQLLDAYLSLQHALAKDVGLPDSIRLLCVKLALRPDVNAPGEARRDLEILFKNEPENSEYEILYSDALIRTNEFAAAEEFLTKAKNRSRDRSDVFLRLAWLKRQRNKNLPVNDSADNIIAEMLDHPEHKKDAQVWLRAADYYRAFGKIPEFERSLAKAATIAPDDPNVVLHQTDYLVSQWHAKFPYGVVHKPTPELDTALVRLAQRLQELIPTLPPLEPRPEINSPGDFLIGQSLQMFRTLIKANQDAGKLEEAEKWARQQLVVFKPYAEYPQYLFLQYDLLEILVEARKLDEARQIAGKLNSLNFNPALVEMQFGFMAAYEKKWIEAARHFERSKSELSAYPDYYRRACILLADAYKQTNQTDLMMTTIQEGTPKDPQDPTFVAAKLRLAEAAIELGRYPEAIQHYTDIREKEPKVLPVLAGLMINEIAQQPAAVRKWNDVESLLTKIPPGPALELARGDLLMAKGDLVTARQRLADAAVKYPKSGEIAVKRFQLEVREKDIVAAEKIVAKAEADFGDTIGIRHLKVTLLMIKSAGKPEAVAELEHLASNLDKFTPPERIHLLRILANAARGLQRFDLAWKWLEDLQALRGEEDMDLQFARFDIALIERNDDRLNKVLSDIGRITGRESPSTKLATAFANIYKAGNLKDPNPERTRLLLTANQLLSGLDTSRKDWSKLHLAKGRAADLQNKNSDAIDHYRRAIQQGERQPEVISRLIDLLVQERRTDLANQILTEFPEASNQIAGESDKMMFLYLNGKEFAKAEDLARKSVPDNATDPAKLLWRVKVHASANNLKEAESLIRRAVELDPTRSDTFMAYVQLLMDKKQPEDAKRFLASNRGKLKAEDASLTIAQCLVVVKDVDEARKLFKEVLDKQGGSIPVLRAAAGFYYSQNDFASARPLLEKLMKQPSLTPADSDMARRMLAICVVAGGDHRTAVQALNLMGFEKPAGASVMRGNETIEELEARFAVLMAIKGRESRLANVAILKKIEEKLTDIGTDKQLAFAKIQFALGDWADAKRRFATAAQAPDRTTATMAPYAVALIRRGEMDEAKKIIDAITLLEPNSILTADLQARHAVYSFNKPKAAEVMKKYLTTKDAQPLIAAQVLEQLGMPEDAEPVFRKFAETSKDPRARLFYAGFLARQGKADAAMTEFEAAWPTSKLEDSVPLLCEAMLHAAGNASPAVISRALQRTSDAVTRAPHLEVYLAAMLSLDPRTEAQALQQFNQILEKDKNNLFALNNLAFMMSVKEGKHSDALNLLRRAVEQVGPQPTLLDTEAVILITSGKGTEAIEKLQEVIVDEPTAVAYVHLAQAYMLINRKNDALVALREAKKFTLRLSDFHPLERPAVRTLLSNPALINN